MNITLRIPEARALGWHKALVGALAARGHAVRAEDAPASPLPLAVRALLWLEGRAFGAGRLGRGLTQDEREALKGVGVVPDLILDLARTRDRADEAPTLDITFDGSPDPNALIGALLAGRSPVMAVRRCEDGAVLAASYPSIDDREVLLRALESAYARMIALYVRAVERHGSNAPTESWSEPAPTQFPERASFFNAVRFALGEFATKLRRQIEKRRPRAAQWSLAARAIPPGVEGLPCLADGPFVAITFGPDAYADPFVHERAGKAVLFAEWQPVSTGKGVIVCARQKSGGAWGPFETCLERPYHLSYPLVFDHDGETWMMPETGANRTLELYRAEDYPARWVLDRVVMRDVSLADATLVQWQGRWWLFAARGEFGGSVMDELVAFHAPSPLGPWTPHALNPLKSDARSARPAGRFIVADGRLYRPAQDCEESYGAGLVWCEVTALTPATFAERVIERWRGADLGAEGVHTFARGGGTEIIDLKGAGRGQAR